MYSRIALSLVFLFAHFPAPAQEPLVPRAELKTIEKAATELAKAGRASEWRELVAIAGDFGLHAKDMASLRAAGEKELARVKAPKPSAPRAATLLREGAAAMAAHLPGVADAAQRWLLAERLVAIDAACAPAQQALARELVGERWCSAGERARAERRAAIQKALQEARALPIEIDIRASDDALLEAILGRKGVLIQSGRVAFHTSRSAEQGARILRQVLRACAFAEFTTTGKVAVPSYATANYHGLCHKTEYDQAIDQALSHGRIDARDAADAKQLSGFHARDGRYTNYAILESAAQASLLVRLDSERLSAEVLDAGQFNWICLAFFGTSLPAMTWYDVAEPLVDSGRSASSDARARAEREELMRLGEAGLLGSRAWLTYLASRREDPPWSAAMRPAIGQITGENLLKATFVYEYLVEEACLVPLDRALRKLGSIDDLPAAFARALEEPLDGFETRWRDWLCGVPPGLVQRLEAQPRPTPPSAVSLLRALDELRARAYRADSAHLSPVPAVVYDEALSAGCLAHAEYSQNHPEMVASWPDAHEQRVDHPDWSSAGAWAGAHSVIAPGATSGEAALHVWMGTFYHRLPLLDPGLLRAGFGLHEEIAVLDCGSMVRPIHEQWIVAWPPDGATNVPLRFVAELPNPVPGADQSTFGYPITLQLGIISNEQPTEVEMELLEGGEQGTPVACHYSSPQKPTNPDLAPPNSFCSIPKEPLKRGTTYTVVARLSTGRKQVWSFRT